MIDKQPFSIGDRVRLLTRYGPTRFVGYVTHIKWLDSPESILPPHWGMRVRVGDEHYFWDCNEAYLEEISP